MQSTMNPKPTDDPHDVLVVAPDVAVMAPTDEELARLARSLRPAANPQPHTAADLPAGAAVPPVDTTFRPTATGDVRLPGRPRTMGARAVRAILVALLLAACAGAAKISWLSYGDAAEAMIAQWAPQRVLALLLPQEKPALPAQPATPAVEATVANPAAPPSGSPAPGAPERVAPTAAAASVDPAPSPGAMTSETASLRQELEQLKASIEELKASQQQMSRDLANASQARSSEVRSSSGVRSSSEVKPSEARAFAAKPSEIKPSEIRASEAKASAANMRPKLSARPWQAPAAPARRPIPPQQAAVYPPPPPAPYVPRQAEPQPPATAETLTDPELASVPRPPMPLR